MAPAVVVVVVVVPPAAEDEEPGDPILLLLPSISYFVTVVMTRLMTVVLRFFFFLDEPAAVPVAVLDVPDAADDLDESMFRDAPELKLMDWNDLGAEVRRSVSSDTFVTLRPLVPSSLFLPPPASSLDMMMTISVVACRCLEPTTNGKRLPSNGTRRGDVR